jgi:hypothetical protein
LTVNQEVVGSTPTWTANKSRMPCASGSSFSEDRKYVLE